MNQPFLICFYFNDLSYTHYVNEIGKNWEHIAQCMDRIRRMKWSMNNIVVR